MARKYDKPKRVTKPFDYYHQGEEYRTGHHAQRGTMIDMQELYEYIIESKNGKAALNKGKNYFKHRGWWVEPVGVDNIKTAIPSVYRPVGSTCPSTCPRIGKGGGCYAMSGNTASTAKFATGDIPAFMRALALGAMVGRAFFNSPCRLCVSGDFFVQPKLGRYASRMRQEAPGWPYRQKTTSGPDWELIEALMEVGGNLQNILNEEIIAWSYTHATYEQWLEFAPPLKEKGINIILSDYAIPGGCITWWWDEAEFLPSGVDYLFCLAQRHDIDVSCGTCQRCAFPRGKCIVFDPHGSFKGVMKISLETPEEHIIRIPRSRNDGPIETVESCPPECGKECDHCSMYSSTRPTKRRID